MQPPGTREKAALTMQLLQTHPRVIVDSLRTRDPEQLANATLLQTLTGKSQEAGDAAWQRATQTLERCERLGIHPIALGNRGYPKRLQAIQEPEAPSLGGTHPYCPMIYVKGNPKALHAPLTAAIVGTRHPSAEGQQQARHFGKTLAQQEIPILSGLAYGCDIEAHRGCLEAKGSGIAVLAHGLDILYPSAHRSEAEALLQHGGCWISEHPPGTRPQGRYFAMRNRLQTALATHVLVVETGAKGGTQITARFAESQGRPLFCLDLPAEGNQALLQGPAKPAGTPEDLKTKMQPVRQGSRGREGRS